MTNPTALHEAEQIAPLGAPLMCPLPQSIQNDEPVFVTDGAMRALATDTYFLTLHRPSDEQDDPEVTWQDEWKITLRIERKTVPAYGRINQWLEANLSGWTLHEWEYDDPDKAPWRGVVGVMAMRAA